MPGSVGGLQVQVQEMLPRVDDPTQYRPGRIITLVFGGYDMKLGLPFSWSGESSWHEVGTKGLVALEDFIGRGSIASGGITIGKFSKGPFVLIWLNAGAMVNITDVPGIDISVPAPTLGEWKQRTGNEPTFGSGADRTRLQQLQGQRQRELRQVGRGWQVGQIAFDASTRLRAELERERESLQRVPNPTPQTRERLQEIDSSIERVAWQIQQLMDIQ
ncbi:MAG: hypothetical protein A2107_08935 [Verrucomicrobia bacterium GWF2_62_7]|nr:MAG: hypothetical protein A2107_08935 [Verrucomicrobia bacterium GWF2_62_7]